MTDMKLKKILGTTILAACAGQLAHAAEPGELLNFVGCPIVQDTDMVPCWMIDYEGERYFLGIQTDLGGWAPPLQGHQLLVEGRVTDLPRVCGGIVLESTGNIFDRRESGSANGLPLPNPPVTSVMRELDPSCRTVLPEDARYNGTIDARRGPGPSYPAPPRSPEEIAAAQRAAQERAARAEAERPRPPYEPKTYEFFYEFDNEYTWVSINQLQTALRYAQEIDASEMEIIGYRGSVLLSNGKLLEELPYMAEHRAKELELPLKMLAPPEDMKIVVRWEDDVLKGTGNDDWRLRKAEIIVKP